MAKERIPRINQLIKKELSQIILREVDFFPDVLATITRVETTPNLIEAKIYVSVLPESMMEKALNTLNRQIYRLQQLLNKRLKMRPTPRIRFVEEKETIRAGRVEEILEKIKIEKGGKKR